MDRESLTDLSRRRLLALAAGGVGAVAGGSYLLDGGPEPDTDPVTDETESRRLAEAYAPTLYFGERERWFPTDPRPYESEQDGDTVVTGFDALDGYTADSREAGEPPNPMTFYQVLQYPDSPLCCVQYWFYSAFDQFTTNFHWHDWEVLHVFVDRSVEGETADSTAETETATPDSGTGTGMETGMGKSVLFVASAHSRKVPNNEYLDPPQNRAGIISEVGSHSSTLGVNAEPATFQRTGLGDLGADISNNPVEIISGQSSLPLAYGLPRDEELTLPFAVPELDGSPLPDHEKLPNLRPEDLLPEEITVEDFDALSNPPKEIPQREGGYAFVPDARADVEGDVRYELTHIDEVRHIDGFTGPTLSFSFRVPQFAEDAFSKHLSTPGVPWVQERFTRPTADISDPQHRAALANRYEAVGEGSELSRILGVVREATSADEAPGSNGVALLVPSLETVALLESEPEAAPTFSGIIAIEDPPEGEHRFTVNGAGMAPYSQALTVDGSGDTRVGVDGRVPMAANEDAVKVEGETDDGAALDAFSLEDDFSGPLYDARPPGATGTFGVYAHRDGAYTAEIRDENGQRGALRVNPNPDDETLGLDAIETGKAALTDYLVRFLVETHAQAAVFEDGTADGIDDVPTGQDVTDEVVSETVGIAQQNAGDLVEGIGDTIDGVLDDEESLFETETATDDLTDTPTVSLPSETEYNRTETETRTGDGTTATERPTPTVTATPTEKKNPGNSDGDNNDPHDDNGDDRHDEYEQTTETGFFTVIRTIDAALLVAVAARAQARSGTAVEANERLESLRERLVTARTTAESSDELPDSLQALAVGRVDRMLPRVEAAIDAEL